jgi:metal-responsive CopG/Arc/MetJ family transcriptional regulator
VGRINVFLTDELLERINEEAKEEKTTRSALIQTALENYIEAQRRDRAEEEKQKTMHKAARKMDALAKKLGKWNAQKKIRKYRRATSRKTNRLRN